MSNTTLLLFVCWNERTRASTHRKGIALNMVERFDYMENATKKSLDIQFNSGSMKCENDLAVALKDTIELYRTDRKQEGQRNISLPGVYGSDGNKLEFDADGDPVFPPEQKSKAKKTQKDIDSDKTQ